MSIRGTLTVRLVSCEGLKSSDMFSAAEAYVVVTVLSESAQSAVVTDNDDPVYNETFSFELTLGDEDSLTFSVFDKDTLRDELIGTATVPLKSAFYGRDGLKKYPLLDRKGKKAGALCAHIKWNAEGLDLEDVSDVVDKALVYLKTNENPNWLKTTVWYDSLKTGGAYVGALPLADRIAPWVVYTANGLLSRVGVKGSEAPEDTEETTIMPVQIVDEQIGALLITVDSVIQNQKANLAQGCLSLKQQIVTAQATDEATRGGVTAFLANVPLIGRFMAQPKKED